MRTLKRLPSLLALVLMLGAAAAPASVAQASPGDTATITVYARGAALGHHAEVQWGDPLGAWHRVDGWTGTLDHLSPQGVPFARWTVFSANFGQKPFRWVIYNPDGKTIWAIGPSFSLPVIPGSDYAQPLDQQPQPGTPAPTPKPGATAVLTPAGAARVLPGHTFTFGLPCFGGDCSFSQISALIGGPPSSTWIAVQWLDVGGQWRTVDGWQGTAISVDANGVLLAQWNIGPELLGRGPFRWALYTARGGSLIGVSPSFNMPAVSRLNLYTTMAVN